jgi:hypothetical protein
MNYATPTKQQARGITDRASIIFIFNEAEMLKGRSLNRITPILHPAAAFNSVGNLWL